jgi:AbiV family abortive infection protein
MAKKPKRADLPDDLHLIQAITAAVGSAQDKHRAAATLVAAGGPWPSVYTLAALGFEELGKANLCLSAIMMRDSPDAGESVSDFWDAFNGPKAHRAKNEFAHFLLRMFGNSMPLPVYEQMIREVSEAAEATNDRKFRALYVDFAEDDVVLRPTDVTEDEAREMTDLLGSALALIETHQFLPVAEDNDADELAAYFQQIRDGLDYDAIAEDIGDDPAKLVEFAEKIRDPILAGVDSPPAIIRWPECF